jgi:hypothetical protein
MFHLSNLCGKTVRTESQFIAKLDKNETIIYRMSKQVYGDIKINITKFYVLSIQDRREDIMDSAKSSHHTTSKTN